MDESMILVQETCVVCNELVLTLGKGVPKCNDHTPEEEEKAYKTLLKSGLSGSETRGTIYGSE